MTIRQCDNETIWQYSNSVGSDELLNDKRRQRQDRRKDKRNTIQGETQNGTGLLVSLGSQRVIRRTRYTTELSTIAAHAHHADE